MTKANPIRCAKRAFVMTRSESLRRFVLATVVAGSLVTPGSTATAEPDTSQEVGLGGGVRVRVHHPGTWRPIDCPPARYPGPTLCLESGAGEKAAMLVITLTADPAAAHGQTLDIAALVTRMGQSRAEGSTQGKVIVEPLPATSGSGAYAQFTDAKRMKAAFVQESAIRSTFPSSDTKPRSPS